MLLATGPPVPIGALCTHMRQVFSTLNYTDFKKNTKCLPMFLLFCWILCQFTCQNFTKCFKYTEKVLKNSMTNFLYKKLKDKERKQSFCKVDPYYIEIISTVDRNLILFKKTNHLKTIHFRCSKAHLRFLCNG